jgi:ABC-type uncharacterized transport system substrate-binding protein
VSELGIYELNVKRLGLLKEAFPSVSRLGILYEVRQAKLMIPPIDAGARSLGLSLTHLAVRDIADIELAFSDAVIKHVEAVMPLSSALLDAEKQRLVSVAAKHRLPAIYEHRPFPEAGGLMSYGPDIQDVFRRAATYVDRILKGAKPADLPVEQATKFELVIGGPYLWALRAQIASLANKKSLPTIYLYREGPDAGGLMSYGTSLTDNWRRAAGYVDKILKSAKPADLPGEQPTKFELVINVKTAKALGLTIPPSLLLRADQVIDP